MINFSDPSLKKYGQVKTSKSEEKSNAKKQNDILLIRLADFINNVVGRRKLPENVNEKLLGTFVCFHEIFQATRGHGWPKASHDHGSAEGRPWVAV